jgi:hypothetical protein
MLRRVLGYHIKYLERVKMGTIYTTICATLNCAKGKVAFRKETKWHDIYVRLEISIGLAFHHRILPKSIWMRLNPIVIISLEENLSFRD